jgi:hydroxymethylbilane synthase
MMGSAGTVLRIGTRGSPLALAQANEVQHRVSTALSLDPGLIAIIVLKTSGDRILDRALSESGGKGLFTKEIDEAQLAGEIDLAVHSGKDLPTALPDGLMLAGFLEREDPRDAFISLKARNFAELAAGAIVGTASLRRQAMVRRLRPDLRVELLRGNVQTRLQRIAEGVCDATILAMAGLNRLGLADRATSILSVDDFLPAVAQGAIAIVIREDASAHVRQAADAIIHAQTTRAVSAERAFLTVLDGSCRTPIAGHAVIQGRAIRMSGLVLRPDGSEWHAESGIADDAETLGSTLGQTIKARLSGDFFVAA